MPCHLAVTQKGGKREPQTSQHLNTLHTCLICPCQLAATCACMAAGWVGQGMGGMGEGLQNACLPLPASTLPPTTFYLLLLFWDVIRQHVLYVLLPILLISYMPSSMHFAWELGLELDHSLFCQASCLFSGKRTRRKKAVALCCLPALPLGMPTFPACGQVGEEGSCLPPPHCMGWGTGTGLGLA